MSQKYLIESFLQKKDQDILKSIDYLYEIDQNIVNNMTKKLQVYAGTVKITKIIIRMRDDNTGIARFELTDGDHCEFPFQS